MMYTTLSICLQKLDFVHFNFFFFRKTNGLRHFFDACINFVFLLSLI